MDGKSYAAWAGTTEKWISNDGIDYVVGSHRNYPGLVHRRRVLFVKPEYWIVLDDVTGQDKGSHTYDQNWHYPLDGGITEDPVNKAVRTGYATGGNLLINAIKYTPDRGSITVSGRAINERNQKPEVEIKIKDTGIAVDPQYQELIFEKFYQTGDVLLHSSGKTKVKGGGPGLGLAIARGIMDSHHGRIWLKSPGYNEETNPGTTVFIRLPVDGSK